jgi:hydroxyacylglutathione hydrolase
MLHTHSFTFNPFQENTWLIWNDNKDCLIIDPGCYSPDEKETLRAFIEKNQLKPVRLLNTHCHIDHVLGNPYVFKQYGLSPEIHPFDKQLLDAVETYGQMWGIHSESQPEPTCNLDILDRIELGDEELEIIFTPGHAPGEVSFFSSTYKFLIAGDVLFHESIGRTDLPGGNHAQLLDTIRKKLFVLDDDVQVHCGHGPSTTIGHEKRFNPFLS